MARPAATAPERGRCRRWVVGAVALVLLAVVAVRWRGSGHPPPSFHTVVVRRGAIVDSVVATCRIEPRTKVDVKAKVNGIVTRLPVDAGDPVSEGQVIAELDKEVTEARVKEARASLLAARAGAEKMHVEVTSAEREYSGRELGRQRALQQGGIISARELEKAKLDFDLAKRTW